MANKKTKVLWMWRVLDRPAKTPPTPHLFERTSGSSSGFSLCGAIIMHKPGLRSVQETDILMGWACKRCARVAAKHGITPC